MKNNSDTTYWDVTKDVMSYGSVGWFVLLFIFPLLILAGRPIRYQCHIKKGSGENK